VEDGTVTAFRWHEAGYLVAAAGKRGERAKLPPFDAVELEIAALLGDDPTE
jgi:hypothetical protein